MSAIEEEMSLLSPPPHPRCSKKGKLVVWSHAKAQAVLLPFHPLDTSGGSQPLVGVTVPVIFHCLRAQGAQALPWYWSSKSQVPFGSVGESA